jgi:hypothetical protein
MNKKKRKCINVLEIHQKYTSWISNLVTGVQYFTFFNLIFLQEILFHSRYLNQWNRKGKPMLITAISCILCTSSCSNK